MRSVFGPVLMVLAVCAYAQRVPSVYDGNGNRLGTHIGGLNFNSEITVAFDDGYFTLVHAITGQIRDGFDPLFESVDCTGQAFGDLRGNIRLNGGGANPANYTLWRHEYEPIDTNPQAIESRLTDDNTCEAFSTTVGSNAVPITQVDPAVYGVTINPPTTLGFARPLKLIMDIPLSEGMFCDGFENCPTP